MKKILISFVLAGMLFALPVQAQTNDELVASLQSQINDLLKIVLILQAQLVEMVEKQAVLEQQEADTVAQEVEKQLEAQEAAKEVEEKAKAEEEEKNRLIAELGARDWFSYKIGKGQYEYSIRENGVSTYYEYGNYSELEVLQRLYEHMLALEEEAKKQCEARGTFGTSNVEIGGKPKVKTITWFWNEEINQCDLKTKFSSPPPPPCVGLCNA